MTRLEVGAAPSHEELLLVPYAVALERLAGRAISVVLLKPDYPCAGRGTLRVVRVEPDPAVLRLVLTYDDYERLE